LVIAIALLVATVLYARAGLAHVDDAAAHLAPEDLVVGENLGSLRAARNDFAVAQRLSGFPLVRALTVVPFLGRQVDGAHQLGAAAHEVLAAGVDAVERSQDGIEGFKRGGEARVRGLRSLASIAQRSRARIDRIDIGSAAGLVGPLGRAHHEFAHRLPELRTGLRDLHDAATGIGDFLDGPRIYVVFAANNNEMRLGSGALLSAGLLLAYHGDIVLYPPKPTALLRVGRLRSRFVTMDADQKALWGWLAPNDDWRNLASSARFDTTAALTLRMMKVIHPGVAVDGVMALDPVALEHLVAATGPVHVGRRQFGGDALLKYVFTDQYRNVKFFDTQQRARRDALGTLAQQAIHHLDDGAWDTKALVRELRAAASGRHMLVWSRHVREQRAWQIAKVDGRLQRDSLFVGLHNRGGNKLDPYLAMHNRIDAEATRDGTDVTVTVTLDNRTPAGLPRYIAGPYPGAVGGGRNVYQGIVAVYVPETADGIAVTRPTGRAKPLIVAAGTDGAHRVVGVQVKLRRGGHDELRFTFHVPASQRSLVVEPSARYPAVPWVYGRDRFDDREARTVRLPARTDERAR
jgi:hypothetical protein